jgi:hypothetical protein
VPGDGSRGHGARGGPGATVDPGGGSWSHEAHGGSGAALCRETRAVGHTGMCAHLIFCLDLNLIRGVSGLQGTDIHAVQQHGTEAVDDLIMASVLDAPVDELDTQNLWEVERELGNKKLAKSYIC